MVDLTCNVRNTLLAWIIRQVVRVVGTLMSYVGVIGGLTVVVLATVTSHLCAPAHHSGNQGSLTARSVASREDSCCAGSLNRWRFSAERECASACAQRHGNP